MLIYSRSLAEHHHHVAEVLQRLREHHLFLKSEKCSFHQPIVQFLGYNISEHSIQMDEGKVNVVRNWPTPTTIKELQRFLLFFKFYRRVIHNYSSITSPLTNLLQKKPKSLSWTPAANQAFQSLKDSFTRAPLLIHPDPNKLFVVEVDASTTGVGAVQSKQQGNPAHLYPCAFFSKKLSPAEINYDIGNRELLAIKLTLEEWRHWLEGAKERFTVLTDQKNLQYLRDAKRLNPRQARWGLFFTCFSYRPWSIHQQLSSSSVSEPSPSGCPPGRTYVPRSQRNNLTHSARSSMGTGHPGANRTLSLLQDRFWWPNMASDVRRVVQGCPDCAISKSPRHLQSGKLLPSPVPRPLVTPRSRLHHLHPKDIPLSSLNFKVIPQFNICDPGPQNQSYG
ncbi:hypothetical protein PO909_032537 [Leuciscus waleckii]